ncbi:hypothetical protein ScPMuIL_014911 [Solemya velum]
MAKKGADVQVSEETLKEWREAFDMFDQNKDGRITSSELGDVMRSLEQSPSEEELRKMIEEVDRDGNGTVEFDEFVLMMKRTAHKIAEESPENMMLGAFAVFDKDGNGLISRTELSVVMTNLGEKLSDEEIDDMIKEADMDGDGQINYKEFIRIFYPSKPY